MQVFLLVDLSGSLRFGSVSLTKAERVAETAAVIALSAAASNDRVGMVTFAGEVRDYIPPDKGRKHALTLVRRILELPGRESHADLDSALALMGRVLSRRALVFIISDFRFPSGSRLLAPSMRRHDIVGIHVFDPRELHVPDLGRIRFRDPESGVTRTVDTGSGAWRKAFAEETRRRKAQREELCRRHSLDLVSISTADDLVLPLRRFFEMRKRRRRR